MLNNINHYKSNVLLSKNNGEYNGINEHCFSIATGKHNFMVNCKIIITQIIMKNTNNVMLIVAAQ